MQSYLAQNYDPSAFHAGLAAAAAIQERQQQVALEAQKEQAAREAEQSKRQWEIQKYAAEKAIDIQAELKKSIEFAQNPVLGRKAYIDTALTNLHGTITKRIENNEAFIKEGTDKYDPKFLQSLADKNKQMTETLRVAAANRPDPTKEIDTTKAWYPDLPEETPPVFSQSYLQKQKDDKEKEQTAVQEGKARLKLIGAETSGAYLGNQIKKAKLDQMSGDSGLSPKLAQAYQKQAFAGMGHYLAASTDPSARWSEGQVVTLPNGGSLPSDLFPKYRAGTPVTSAQRTWLSAHKAYGAPAPSQDVVKSRAAFEVAAPAMVSGISALAGDDETRDYFNHILDQAGWNGSPTVDTWGGVINQINADASQKNINEAKRLQRVLGQAVTPPPTVSEGDAQ